MNTKKLLITASLLAVLAFSAGRPLSAQQPTHDVAVSDGFDEASPACQRYPAQENCKLEEPRRIAFPGFHRYLLIQAFDRKAR